jgi:acetoacetyl-CoA synthetase
LSEVLWSPTAERQQSSHLYHFLKNLGRDPQAPNAFRELYSWSIAAPEKFWEAVRTYCDVQFSSDFDCVIAQREPMYCSSWYRGATLNFAEHLLRRNDEKTGLIFRGESSVSRTYSFKDLRHNVALLQRFLKDRGVRKGDRIAAVMPNAPETIISMLACASIGAIWSSCSPDFGLDGILDRFQQIEPAVLIYGDGYLFKEHWIDCVDKFKGVLAGLPTVHTAIISEYEVSRPATAVLNAISSTQGTSSAYLMSSLLNSETTSAPTFEPVDFSHPLFIMFSSGTTGKPKCIVHQTGGVLLEHKKELMLHTDLHATDVFFYQTTCGWMMWNWLASGLSVGATLLLYDGAPFLEDGRILWRLAEEHSVTVFGTNAKYVSALEKQGVRPATEFDISTIRTVLSTGSPLLPESFDFVYREIGSDICLSSISGGTDILGCFALGCPILPVRRGELQCRSLGLAVSVFNNEGTECIPGEQGELVCTAPFPSMPIGFWNDPLYEKYQASYFGRFPNIWTHGDFVELRPEGGMIFFGRSDATLNPGGVRIGTAEIYQQVEKLDAIVESIVIGQNWKGDVRIVLFVVLQAGFTLTAELERDIKKLIRDHTSPFHVPKKIIAVPEIPRTRSGKIVELAVRDTVEGRTISNLSALANPDSLQHFSHIPALEVD